jgi:hypothetical protein
MAHRAHLRSHPRGNGRFALRTPFLGELLGLGANLVIGGPRIGDGRSLTPR